MSSSIPVAAEEGFSHGFIYFRGFEIASESASEGLSLSDIWLKAIKSGERKNSVSDVETQCNQIEPKSFRATMSEVEATKSGKMEVLEEPTADAKGALLTTCTQRTRTADAPACSRSVSLL